VYKANRGKSILQSQTNGEERYEIYYSKGTKVPLQKDKKIEISGNNMDGFIVTTKIEKF